jgi:multiple sugar transport system permease protein
MKERTNFWIVFIFFAPALTAIFIFFLIPVISALLISLTDYDIYTLGDFRRLRFIGVENYFKLFEDELFFKALLNTFYFVLVGGPLSILVSLSTALLLNSRLIKFKKIFRTIYFIPVVTTLVAVAIVWRYIYHPRFGLINYILHFLGIGSIDWLGDPTYAMPAIIILAIWKNFGYNMILFIAGLQNIPQDLYEVAELDGASAWFKFKTITLPLLAPTTFFTSIITMIGYFQLFAEPYVMTQGGPLNSTLSIVLYMYQEGFRWWDIGYSVSIAFVLFAIILVGTIIQFRYEKRIHY